MGLVKTGLRRRRGPVLFILLGALLLSPAARAETVTLPAIDLARTLILRKHYDAARSILTILHEKDPANIEAQFLLAEADAETGNLESAVERYREILVNEPNVARVRLDLAAALFLLGEDEVAEYHFRQALTLDLPPEVARKVYRYLDRIRARKRFTFDLGVALAPDSNVNTGSSASEVEIFGQPARLSDDARKQSGVGATVSVGGEFRQPLTARWRLRFGGFGYRTEYANGEFDDMFARIYAGPQLLYPRGGASLLAVFDKRWYGNEPYFERWGPRIEASYGLTQRIRLQADAEYLETAYQGDRDFMDGYELSIGLAPSVALSPSAYLRLIARYGQERTRESYLDNDSYRVGIGYHQEMPFGITAYLQPDVTFYDYRGVNLLFGKQRDDREYRARVSLYKRDWTVFGFSPVLSYVYTRYVSNIDLFEYDRHQLQIGMTRQF